MIRGQTHLSARGGPAGKARGRPGRRSQSGSTLVLVLAMIAVVMFLAIALISATEVELQTSVAGRDRLVALNDTDSALSEVIYRFNLTPGPAAPPVGSTLAVNATSALNAYLDYDPFDLLTNDTDDDGDGDTDEPDELNLTRDWSVRIVLQPDDAIPGGLPDTVYVVDTDPTNGPPWGSKLIVQTIQPQASWRSYTTADPTSPEVLTVRFKLDTDTVVGDSEGDGAEIVFYDPSLRTNGKEDVNTLTSLGGDANPTNDSPYNITWSDGATTPATGQPVLLVEATARVGRRQAAGRRTVEAELARTSRPVFSKAVCGCSEVTLSGVIDSYRSSEGTYGTGPIRDNGNVGSNGDVTLTGGGIVTGASESGGDTKLSGVIKKDAWAGGAIVTTAEVMGAANEYVTPKPQPCPCNDYDLPALMAEKRAVNDNAGILPDGAHAYQAGSCDVGKVKIWKKPYQLDIGSHMTVILSGGSYFMEQLKVSEFVQVGVDTDGDCLVDQPPTEPVMIYVEGDVDLSGQGILNASQRAEDLQILMLSENNSLDINGSFTFRGTIYAPGVDCNISGGATIEGAVVCGVVKGGGDGIHYDEDLAAGIVVDGGVSLLAWHELD